MDPLSDDYLKEIEKRAAAAPKRPMHMEEIQPEIWEIWKREECHVTYAKFYSENAAVFFCEALKDIPALLAEIRRLKLKVSE